LLHSHINPLKKEIFTLLFLQKNILFYKIHTLHRNYHRAIITNVCLHLATSIWKNYRKIYVRYRYFAQCRDITTQGWQHKSEKWWSLSLLLTFKVVLILLWMIRQIYLLVSNFSNFFIIFFHLRVLFFFWFGWWWNYLTSSRKGFYSCHYWKGNQPVRKFYL